MKNNNILYFHAFSHNEMLLTTLIFSEDFCVFFLFFVTNNNNVLQWVDANNEEVISTIF